MEIQKSAEQRKQAILEGLNRLKKKYPKLEDILVKFEHRMLGEGEEGAVLRIESIDLIIRRNQDSDSVLQTLENFIIALESEPQENAAVAHVHTEVTNVIEPLVEGRDKTYWRDVAASISFMKNHFKGLEIATQLIELRKLIHEKALGRTDFEIKEGNVLLQIKKGDNEAVILSKLSRFIKAIQNQTPDMQKQAEPRKDVELKKTHLESWAMALGALTTIKKLNKDNSKGELAQELRDWTHSHYTLGQSYELSLKTPQGETVVFSPKDDNETALTKVTHFIENLQNAGSTGQDMALLTEGKKESIAQKNKLYWRDISAGLDILQRDYPAKDYGGLENLRQMIEENELASGSSVILDIEGAKLVIRKKDSDEVIKNKISVFIGILKQLASQKKEVANPLYWRDILADLNAMQDIYGEEGDYQLLIMSLEMGTLATARDLDINIGGHGLRISMHDTDQQLKEKMSKFINELKKAKNVKVSQGQIDKYKKRIEAMERETQQKQIDYERKIHEQGDKIRRLEGDLNYEKSRATPTYQPPISQTTSYSRSFSG